MKFQQLARKINLAIIAPVGQIPFQANVLYDKPARSDLIEKMQTARGRCYVSEGAIPASALQEDGRHQEIQDYNAWTILSMNSEGDVQAAVRFSLIHHPFDFNTLRVHQFIKRIDSAFSTLTQAAVSQHLIDGEVNQVNLYVEIGGWFATPQAPPIASIGVILGGWSIFRLFGRTRGVALATSRNNSSDILCRMGGYHLESEGHILKDIYDPYHKCPMSVLGFDSWQISKDYQKLRDEGVAYFSNIPIWGAQK